MEINIEIMDNCSIIHSINYQSNITSIRYIYGKIFLTTFTVQDHVWGSGGGIKYVTKFLRETDPEFPL